MAHLCHAATVRSRHSPIEISSRDINALPDSCQQRFLDCPDLATQAHAKPMALVAAGAFRRVSYVSRGADLCRELSCRQIPKLTAHNQSAGAACLFALLEQLGRTQVPRKGPGVSQLCAKDSAGHHHRRLLGGPSAEAAVFWCPSSRSSGGHSRTTTPIPWRDIAS